MALTQKTDHTTEGPNRLLSQYVRQPNMRAILEAYLTQVQEIEDVAFQILDLIQNLEGQEGEQLDLWGRILGQDRLGWTDAQYIKRLQARQIINRASGIPDEILTVTELMSDLEAELEEYFPASIVVRLTGILVEDPAFVASAIEETRAAGVGASLEYSTAIDAEMFQFASADVEELDLDAGHGGVADGIDNGDFALWTLDDPDDWTVSESGFPNDEVYESNASGSFSPGGEHATFTSGTSTTSPYIEQTLTVLSGVQHTITLSVTAGAGASPGIRVQDTGGEFNQVIALTGTGDQLVTFTPIGSSITLRVSLVRGDGGAPPINHSFTLSEIKIESDAGGIFAGVVEA